MGGIQFLANVRTHPIPRSPARCRTANIICMAYNTYRDVLLIRLRHDEDDDTSPGDNVTSDGDVDGGGESDVMDDVDGDGNGDAYGEMRAARMVLMMAMPMAMAMAMALVIIVVMLVAMAQAMVTRNDGGQAIDTRY